MSTGPLNLNWISNAFKPPPRSGEPPTAPAAPDTSSSLTQDNASLTAGQQRYMAFADVPSWEEPTTAAPEATPPSSGLDVDWVTGSSTPQEPAATGGLDLEWRSGPSMQSTSRQANTGGLDLDWRGGPSGSGSGLGNAGQSGSAGLELEWRQGHASPGTGLGNRGSGSGARNGGLDVEWRGGSTRGVNGGSSSGTTPGVGGSLSGGSTPGIDGGMHGGSTRGVGGGASGGVQAGGSTLGASELLTLQGKLTAPLGPIPESPTSDHWRQNDLRNRAALVVAIRTDAGLQEALANWDRLPDATRLEAGKRIAALQGAIYGFTPANVQLDSSLRPPEEGYYNPISEQMHISRDVLADARNFVNTVAHEQAHAYQWEKGKAAATGQMLPSDPLYPAARSWYDNYFNYQQPTSSYQAYRTQPIEEHAFATGDAVAGGVFS